MKKSLVLATALIALAGCAENFNARVSRFQALPPASGQSFAVQADDPRLQGGIEFGQYAQLVTAQLVHQGYRPAAEPSHADFVVHVGYKVDSGRERVVSSYGGYGYGGFGYGHGGFGYPYGLYGRRFIYGFLDPFLYGGFGGFGGSDVTSYTVYTSQLNLRIDRTDTGQRVFEGTARAESRDDELPHLVPNLIEAMFTGFPGNSGQTVNISIAPPEKHR